jgi:hypothetical protein
VASLQQLLSGLERGSHSTNRLSTSSPGCVDTEYNRGSKLKVFYRVKGRVCKKSSTDLAQVHRLRPVFSLFCSGVSGATPGRLLWRSTAPLLRNTETKYLRSKVSVQRLCATLEPLISGSKVRVLVRPPKSPESQALRDTTSKIWKFPFVRTPKLHPDGLRRLRRPLKRR